MRIDARDSQILRELARRLAEIASQPVQQERIRMWKEFNALRPQRPMVLAYPEGGWRDLLDESALQCQDTVLRQWEMALRQQIYHAEHIDDDRPITGAFRISWVIRRGDYGAVETRHHAQDQGAFNWDAPIKTADDLKKLHFRKIEVDREETQRRVDAARDIFGDLLTVSTGGSLWWTCGLTQTLIFLRGLEQVMLDMYDNPQMLHDLMAFLRDAMQDEIDTYVREGVVSLNTGPEDYVGSGGVGATDELPAKGLAGCVRPRDMWVLGESQEFVGVGPELFEEFALQYQAPILNRFGLVCYGCCEPLDRKLDLVLRYVPKVRRVSVSPWFDRKVAAEKLTNKYIFSWKPNPALICGPTVDWDAVEKVTRETLQIARGCCLEMIMKDTHTFHGQADRVGKWVQIASRLAREAI